MNSGFNPQNNPFSSTTQNLTVAQSSAETRMNFIRKTYMLFLAGILTSVVAGAACLQIPSLFQTVMSVWRMPLLAILLIVGGSIGAQALSRVEGLNYGALFGFTGLIGLMFAPILRMYEASAPGIVGQAAFLTIVIFGSLTTYAFVSRKDFSFLGGMLFVGMMGIVLAGIGNALWFRDWGFSYWLAWGTLFFSSGFVLYKTSNIIHHYSERDYCAAALGLFISFFNIFMSVLRILSGRR